MRRTVSTATDPALLDHCFYRQPAGWPTVADRFPVVPMTMMIEMMLDAARALGPGRVAVAARGRPRLPLARGRAAGPVEIAARVTGGDAVDVELPGYARATVRLAAAYPPARRRP